MSTLNANVEVVQDRGHLIEFTPSLAEIHQQVATWFWDQEVFDWMADHLAVLAKPSMRDYVRGVELRKAGLPWKKILLTQFLPERTAIVSEFKDDNSFETEEQRAAAFVVAGHGSRATYFNHARKLKTAGKGSLPKLPLPNSDNLER